MCKKRQSDSDSCCACFRRKKMPEKNAVSPPTPPVKQDFVMELPRKLTEGTAIVIKGGVGKNTSVFAVNLTTSNDAMADITFHFNPRITEHYIVRNHKLRNIWGTEETTSICKFNADDFLNFILIILATDKEFLVCLNGRMTCAFKHRIPLSKTHFLQVDSVCNIAKVEITTLTQFPSMEDLQKNVYKVPILAGDFTTNKDIFITPINGFLPIRFESGWQLNITGRVKLLPHSFFINLQNNLKVWPHPLIPLHINPRFNVTPGQNVLVRNSWFNNSWGSEERTPSFPFYPGDEFSLTITMENDFFAVWVNNVLTGEFRLRGACEIYSVYIQGDVFIHQIVMGKHFVESRGKSVAYFKR